MNLYCNERLFVSLKPVECVLFFSLSFLVVVVVIKHDIQKKRFIKGIVCS